MNRTHTYFTIFVDIRAGKNCAGRDSETLNLTSKLKSSSMFELKSVNMSRSYFKETSIPTLVSSEVSTWYLDTVERRLMSVRTSAGRF